MMSCDVVGPCVGVFRLQRHKKELKHETQEILGKLNSRETGAEKNYREMPSKYS